LILSLGGFAGKQISPALQIKASEYLIRLYKDNPDPGIHSAIRWLLGNGKQGLDSRAMDWKRDEALKRIDAVSTSFSSGRDWYVTKEGQTMAVIRGPAEFT